MVTSDEKIARKNEVLGLLSHPLIVEFLDKAETQLFRRWKGTAPDDSEQRETLHLQYLGLKAFEEFFRQVVIDGEMEEKILEGKYTDTNR